MLPVPLKIGKTLLPNISRIRDILEKKVVEPQALTPEEGLGLLKQAARLADSNLKPYGVNRMVKKTSERQSRWLIEAAILCWQEYANTAIQAERSGLYVGLGAVDCDDDDQPTAFNGELADYAEQKLTHSSPLSCLTKLNSTAACHIANILNITGTNAAFSPWADAGSSALIEAFYAINERDCDQALVAAGSQKITPWYVAAYHQKINTWQENDFATESATALIAAREMVQADGQLLAVARAFSSDSSRPYPQLRHWLDQQATQGHVLPKQVIHCGQFRFKPEQQNFFNQYSLGIAHHCFIDGYLGFTGAASALHGVALALEMLKTKQGIDDDKAANPTLQKAPILVLSYGSQGQINYLLVGAIS